MATPPLQQRYPFDLTGKVHPDVEAAIRYSFSGLLDLNQANTAVAAQIKALQAATSATTGTTTTSVAATAVEPVNTPPVASQWFAGYNSASGNFSQTQPSFADLSGNLTSIQLPASVPVVSFGTGAPSGSSTEGFLYFDTSGAPYNGYVYHGSAWHAFS